MVFYWFLIFFLISLVGNWLWRRNYFLGGCPACFPFSICVSVLVPIYLHFHLLTMQMKKEILN
jgi:hypothetical protein